MTGPWETARSALESRLAHWARQQALPAPYVATIGDTDALRPELGAALTRRALARVHVTPESVLVGPWSDDNAGTGGCGNCLAMRWQRLRGSAERDALETGSAVTGTGAWPLITDFAATAVWATYRLGSPARPRSGAAARVIAVDLTTLHASEVPLLPEPLCPHCAERRSSERALTLVPRIAATTAGHRLRTPASYRLPAAALANPVCGVLGGRVSTDLTSPTTAPAAGAVLMRTHSGLSDMTWSGKANTFRASRDLALLEGLERYAGTHRRHRRPPLRASYDALVRRGTAVLDPRDCGEYAPETYRAEADLRPFDPAAEIPWVRGHSLRSGRPVLVPLRLAYYCEGSAEDAFVDECSNGCAIGSCLEEAVLSGLLELIERDAFLLAWYGRPPLTEIDLDACGGDTVPAMLDRARLQGYHLRAFDTRADLPIPVVTSLAVRRDGGPGTLSFAAAAALDPMTAIENALAETLTYLPQLPARVLDRKRQLSGMARDFNLVRALPDHSALFGLPEMAHHADGYLHPAARRRPQELYADWERERPRSEDLLDAVWYCRDALVHAGHDVIVVDQTSPEQHGLGLSTIRALVPGLLPMDFGWSRQRALHLPRLHRFLPPGRAAHLVPHPFS
ncbi:TOMM precursor leader peptide-binding protein [Kitasatospora sp. NPDC004669]|uniref:TOMM precursor leader peptide-binding protein n=1 Tax=Kitasatospora sp. NPDC004669 TaxID=3154555 RepID=UPI0033A70914